MTRLAHARRTAAAALALLAAPALAATVPPPPEAERFVPGGRGGFVTDGAGGCWIWVSGIPAGAGPVTATWSGACPDGPAEGDGRSDIRWTEGGVAQGMTHEGTLRRGKAEGPGRLTHTRGGRVTTVEEGEFRDDFFAHGRLTVEGGRVVYEGAWRRTQPHGPGRLTIGRETFEGVWENGCLKVKDGWVAFTRPAEECEGRAT